MCFGLGFVKEKQPAQLLKKNLLWLKSTTLIDYWQAGANKQPEKRKTDRR